MPYNLRLVKSLREKYKGYRTGDRVVTKVGKIPVEITDEEVSQYSQQPNPKTGKPARNFTVNPQLLPFRTLREDMVETDPTEEKALEPGRRAIFHGPPSGMPSQKVEVMEEPRPGSEIRTVIPTTETRAGYVMPVFDDELSEIDPKTGENLNLKALRKKYKAWPPGQRVRHSQLGNVGTVVSGPHYDPEDTPGHPEYDPTPYPLPHSATGKRPAFYHVNFDSGEQTEEYNWDLEQEGDDISAPIPDEDKSLKSLRAKYKARQPGQRVRIRQGEPGANLGGGAIVSGPHHYPSFNTEQQNQGKQQHTYEVQFDSGHTAHILNQGLEEEI